MNSAVYTLTSIGGGYLVAGGTLLVAGGLAANRVAFWTGFEWVPLGSGMNGVGAGARRAAERRPRRRRTVPDCRWCGRQPGGALERCLVVRARRGHQRRRARPDRHQQRRRLRRRGLHRGRRVGGGVRGQVGRRCLVDTRHRHEPAWSRRCWRCRLATSSPAERSRWRAASRRRTWHSGTNLVVGARCRHRRHRAGAGAHAERRPRGRRLVRQCRRRRRRQHRTLGRRGLAAELGLGTDGSVEALFVLGNGDLVAGGAFTNAGGAGPARRPLERCRLGGTRQRRQRQRAGVQRAAERRPGRRRPLHDRRRCRCRARRALERSRMVDLRLRHGRGRVRADRAAERRDRGRRRLHPRRRQSVRLHRAADDDLPGNRGHVRERLPEFWRQQPADGHGTALGRRHVPHPWLGPAQLRPSVVGVVEPGAAGAGAAVHAGAGRRRALAASCTSSRTSSMRRSRPTA